MHAPRRQAQGSPSATASLRCSLHDARMPVGTCAHCCSTCCTLCWPTKHRHRSAQARRHNGLGASNCNFSAAAVTTLACVWLIVQPELSARHRALQCYFVLRWRAPVIARAACVLGHVVSTAILWHCPSFAKHRRLGARPCWLRRCYAARHWVSRAHRGVARRAASARWRAAL